MNSAEMNQSMQEMEQALEGVTPGMLGGMIAVLVIFVVAWYILSSIGYFKMFKKAGHRGILAYIPVVRNFVYYKFAWKIGYFWIWLVADVLFWLFSESEQFGLQIVALVAGILWIVLDLKVRFKIAKSFGKGAGCGILLFFFPFIVSLVLGFGKAEYVGNPSKKQKEITA